jgi:hypothetical protein
LKSKRIEISLFRQQFNNSLTNLPGKIDTYLNKVDNISSNIVGEEFFQDKKRKKVSNERAQKVYLNNFGQKSKKYTDCDSNFSWLVLLYIAISKLFKIQRW